MDKTIKIKADVKATITYLVCDIDNQIMKYHSLIKNEPTWKFWENSTYSYRYICPKCGSTKVTKNQYPLINYKLIPEEQYGKNN